MRDNKTSQPAGEYDSSVRKTIPYYDCLHDSILNLVEVYNSNPRYWLDTGGGTGTLVAKAADRFSGTAFTLADPAEAMIALAKEKLAQVVCTYLAAASEQLVCLDESFDVISAVLAHHYLDVETRQAAMRNCFRMLKRNGLYMTFETILPASAQGKELGLEMWRQAQLRRGKDEAAVERHISRYGQEFFPITVEAHIELLRSTGFSAVEILWVSGLQAGFYAIK